MAHTPDTTEAPQAPTILIVDDSSTMRLMIKRAAAASGASIGRTLEAANGQEALDILKAESVQALFTDINMPVMDGLEFIQAVRRDRTWDGVRLVMVTTETETDQMLRALSAGADEYLMKPFQKDSLIQKLQLVGVAN